MFFFCHWCGHHWLLLSIWLLLLFCACHQGSHRENIQHKHFITFDLFQCFHNHIFSLFFSWNSEFDFFVFDFPQWKNSPKKEIGINCMLLVGWLFFYCWFDTYTRICTDSFELFSISKINQNRKKPKNHTRLIGVLFIYLHFISFAAAFFATLKFIFNRKFSHLSITYILFFVCVSNDFHSIYPLLCVPFSIHKEENCRVRCECMVFPSYTFSNGTIHLCRRFILTIFFLSARQFWTITLFYYFYHSFAALNFVSCTSVVFIRTHTHTYTCMHTHIYAYMNIYHINRFEKTISFFSFLNCIYPPPIKVRRKRKIIVEEEDKIWFANSHIHSLTHFTSLPQKVHQFFSHPFSFFCSNNNELFPLKNCALGIFVSICRLLPIPLQVLAMGHWYLATI